MRINAGVPVWVRAEESLPLQRIALGDRGFPEAWLQELIYKHPAILPVAEIDPSFGPLVPLAREMTTRSGPIDSAYISPTGLLTLAEAKLWRNPQARREVVAQILDYATDLTRWSYEELDQHVRKIHGRSLYAVAQAGLPETDRVDEAMFVDAVSRNLRQGRLLLLIVGDGIREETERLVSFLQQTPHLHFILALVEIRLFRLPRHSDPSVSAPAGEEEVLAVPSVVAQTVAIERAVVLVDEGKAAAVHVTFDLDADGESRGRRPRLVEEEFFEQLRTRTSDQGVDAARRLLRDAQELGFAVDWGESSYILKLDDPAGSPQQLTILVVEKYGTCYVGWLDQQTGNLGLPKDPAVRYIQDATNLLGAAMKEKNWDSWRRSVPLEVVASKYEELLDLMVRFRREMRDAAEASARQRT